MYEGLGWNEAAREVFEFCYRIRCRVIGPESDDAMNAALRLAQIYQLEGNASEAANIRDALSQKELELQRERQKQEQQELLPDRLHRLSDAYWSQGNFELVISLGSEVLSTHTATLGTGMSPYETQVT